MTYRIALVDDEPTIISSLRILLEEEGFDVTGFTDSEQAEPHILSGKFDIAVLDVKMPRLDGLELLRRIREVSPMPVLMLTSRDHEVDEMLGLRMGADDYIKKPFSPRLLVARIHACMRQQIHQRAPKDTRNTNEGDNSVLQIGNLKLDVDRHECSINGAPVSLTVTELLLLKCLMTRPGHARSRATLMDAAYGANIHVDDRTIDSHIKRIRRKLREQDPDFHHIETLYGLGYRFQDLS